MNPRLGQSDLQGLAERIEDGAVFIYPTDTCYGLGCSIHRSEAIGRIFDLKGRSEQKPVPSLVHRDQVSNFARIEPVERAAMEEFWPGGLTLVLECSEVRNLDDRLLDESTIAIREPDLTPLVEVIETTGPIVGTSANISGNPSPQELGDVHPELFQQVDFILGESRGSGESSTVAEWIETRNQWVVHREGPISKASLEHLV